MFLVCLKNALKHPKKGTKTLDGHMLCNILTKLQSCSLVDTIHGQMIAWKITQHWERQSGGPMWSKAGDSSHSANAVISNATSSLTAVQSWPSET